MQDWLLLDRFILIINHNDGYVYIVYYHKIDNLVAHLTLH